MAKERGTSPAATGPAGADFESSVAAHYLLSMLVGGAPGGLPGAETQSITLQAADEGAPLDDVWVKATPQDGIAASIQVQVKREIQFTKSNAAFGKTVGQILESVSATGFFDQKNELAIAVERGPRKVSGAIQDVLNWAREISDAKTFFDKLSRAGSANDDMRDFVEALRHQASGHGHDLEDELLHRILSRLQVFVLDFGATGSTTEQLVIERCRIALEPDQSDRAADLWRFLRTRALEIASYGGVTDKEKLTAEVSEAGFPIQPIAQFRSAIRMLMEDAHHALRDIRKDIEGTELHRRDPLEATRTALSKYRFVEIRGDGGTGKSALLRHLAEEISRGSAVLVFAANRTIGGGWRELSSRLDLKPPCKELLVEVATTGGATIFIDGMERFSETQQTTVCDILRTAGDLPGVRVLATTRNDFGVDGSGWLHHDIVDAFGERHIIPLGELSEPEIEELKAASPHLKALLQGSHPAFQILKNPLRLARVAAMIGDPSELITETRLAAHWWSTADGPNNEHRRGRQRVLLRMAQKALVSQHQVDIDDFDPFAIEELKASRSILEPSSERASFAHDVLREWALFVLLRDRLEAFDELKLDAGPDISIARAVELLARHRLETESSGASWRKLLDQVSSNGCHPAWRRAVVLALVRSELSYSVLSRMKAVLFADAGTLLQEVLALTRSVESSPLKLALDAIADSAIMRSTGFDPADLSDDMIAPKVPSWMPLIKWLLDNADEAPANLLPEIVDLLLAWTSTMVTVDPCGAEIAARFHSWLMAIEAAESSRDWTARLNPFGEALSSDKTDKLRESLMNGFLLTCANAPELAKEYLQFQIDHSRPGARDFERIVDQPGLLAQAAPKELAELTKRSLVKEAEEDGRYGSALYDRGFSFLDTRFLNKSPTRGPFLKLLQNDFDTGLSLITDLAVHAAEQFPGFSDPAAEALIVDLSGKKFTFPYPGTYGWSRQASGYYSLTCALMALELWGHHQIEAGTPVKEVVGKILWRDGIPAAFLLVAVDLVLCHFEDAAETAMDLIASPELLVVDYTRWAKESFVTYGFSIGSGGTKQDHRAMIDLKSRPSRDRTLVDMLGQFALGIHNSHRETLISRLESVAVKYPEYGPDAARGDPSYMVRHAINQLVPENWRNKKIVLDDGRRVTGVVYVSPEPEASHIGRLRAELTASQADERMPFELAMCVDEPSRSSREFAERAIKWATGRAPDLSGDDLDNERFKELALVAAAVIALRDGDEGLWRDNESWIRETLSAAAGQPDKGHMPDMGISHEPAAMAFAGFAYLWLADRLPDDLEAMLALAACRRAAVVGYKAVDESLFEAEPRLAKSLLRTGLNGCIQPRRNWEVPDEEWQKAHLEREERLSVNVQPETQWLLWGGDEPEWPELPEIRPRERTSIQIGAIDRATDSTPPAPPPAHYFDHKCAASWFPPKGHSVDWYNEILQAYSDWTLTANGAGGAWNVDSNFEIVSWNYAWTHGAVDWFVSEQPDKLISELVEPLLELPDSPFLDMASLTFPYLVVVHIAGRLPKKIVVDVHQIFLDRLEQTRDWQSQLRQDRNSSTVELGASLACLFFNIKPFGQTPHSFLGPDEVEAADPFVPTLEQFVSTNGTIATALNACIFLESRPRPLHLQMTFNLLHDLIQRKGNDHEFWIELGFGKRFCNYWKALHADDRSTFAAGSPDRIQLDSTLSALIGFGVAEASQLEVELTHRDELS